MALPIYEIEHDIIARLQIDRRLILSAPTGSGKSTQVPQMLLKHGLLGDGQVVILQPRRLAARVLAARVAQELGVRLGDEVGYQIRFENCTSAKTRIRFVTEGVLLRQLIDDPHLRGVSVILFDEFHERHLYGDITLARALDLQEQQRPDLRLAVMSATLKVGELEKYLSSKSEIGNRKSEMNCSVIASEGRMFPVEVEYLPRRVGLNGPPVWELAAEEFSRFVQAGGEGDVLVFMPGGFEISQTIEALRHTREAKGFLILPLHGELQPKDQDAAVARYQQPKVVVATNVAETSITIDGVRLVVDSGLARIARYDANRGINTLMVEKISQASAEQRTGRAGRTAPGKCARLWSRPEHDERPPHELPEIRRLDLSEVVLTLKAAGVDDLRRFRWLEKPDEIALTHAEELLEDLGAIKAVAQAFQPAGSRLSSPVFRELATGKSPEPADRNVCATTANHAGRAQDASVSAAPALCAHVAGRAGIPLRASGLPGRSADARARFAPPQFRPRGGSRARKFAGRTGRFGFLGGDARVELCGQ